MIIKWAAPNCLIGEGGSTEPPPQAFPPGTRQPPLDNGYGYLQVVLGESGRGRVSSRGFQGVRLAVSRT